MTKPVSICPDNVELLRRRVLEWDELSKQKMALLRSPGADRGEYERLDRRQHGVGASLVGTIAGIIRAFDE